MTDKKNTPTSEGTSDAEGPQDFFDIPDESPARSSSTSSSDIDTLILKKAAQKEGPASSIETVIRGPNDPEQTVVETARAIGNMGRDLLEPVEHLIGEHATRVERVRSLVRDLDSNYLRVLLALEGLSLIVVVGIVSFLRVPDSFMYVLMEFLIGISLLRYIRTSVEDQGSRRWVVGALVAVLSLLWAGLLYNKVPPEPLWYDPDGGIREELPLLWAPIVGHITVAVGLVLHLPLRGRLRARRMRG